MSLSDQIESGRFVFNRREFTKFFVGKTPSLCNANGVPLSGLTPGNEHKEGVLPC